MARRPRRAHRADPQSARLRAAESDPRPPRWPTTSSTPTRAVSGAPTKTTRARTDPPGHLAELKAIAVAMPDRWRLAVGFVVWCSLRFGEVAELRRKDVDLDGNRLRVRRAVTYVDEVGNVVGPPKTAPEVRDVAIPPHQTAEVRGPPPRARPARAATACCSTSATGGHSAVRVGHARRLPRRPRRRRTPRSAFP